METYYVYILQSQFNDSFYKGSTDNLFRRFKEHNDGKEKSTCRYVPWDLVWYTEKATRPEALILEKKLKNLSVKRTIEFISKYPVQNVMGVLTLARVRQSGC
ncbi:MAG TPA: GIY-YIG nuclease family protein [Cyclobacteriaceae bacterium]